jgi:hypothetical protein
MRRVMLSFSAFDFDFDKRVKARPDAFACADPDLRGPPVLQR